MSTHSPLLIPSNLASPTRSLSQLLEQLGLLLHYSWSFGALFFFMSPLRAILFFTVAQTVCGLLLALVFGVGHNGMAVFDADAPAGRPDFCSQQIASTRNVDSSWAVDWFCGGLQYQIEHHIFPSMPRHNLGKVAPLVRSLAKEMGVPYHSTGLLAGSVEVLSYLGTVSEEFLKEFPAM